MPHLHVSVVLSSLNQATSIAVCKTTVPAWPAEHEMDQLHMWASCLKWGVDLAEALPNRIFIPLSMRSIRAYNIHSFHHSRIRQHF